MAIIMRATCYYGETVRAETLDDLLAQVRRHRRGARLERRGPKSAPRVCVVDGGTPQRPGEWYGGSAAEGQDEAAGSRHCVEVGWPEHEDGSPVLSCDPE
jgi:hypothetical protein